MQSLNSLYFPETVLPHHLRNCLLLLPDTLHSLQPVEPDPAETDPPASNDLFMEQSICQAHTPSPLGKDRERFMGLLEEIRTRKDSFAEQLSSLTLAHLSHDQGHGEHNHQTIMSTILKGQPSVDGSSEEDNAQAALWQARLVLALAEILDREEAELAETLSDIDETEMALFQELKGEAEDGLEEDNPFAELLRIKAKLSQPRPGTIKKRLAAWKTLYASGRLKEQFWLWTACQEEAADLLIESYESASGRDGVPLLRIKLPAQIYMRENDALESIRNFQEKAEKVRRPIIDKLRELVTLKHLNIVDPVALLPDAGTLARDWNELIEYFFPQERFGSRTLDLQFLANISLDQLLRGPDAAGKEDRINHGIVAICRH